VIVRGVTFQSSETAKIKDLLHPVTKYIQDALEVTKQAEKE